MPCWPGRFQLRPVLRLWPQARPAPGRAGRAAPAGAGRLRAGL
jgi:hypothetical protein